MRELLRHYDKLEIQAEIDRYEEALAAEHARLAAMASEYTDPARLAEARTKVAPAVGWVSRVAPEHQSHFEVLVHIIVALRVWNEEGADAGMRVLLGDKESAEFWRLGLVNADAHEYGAEQKKRSTALEHVEDAERFLELALDFRNRVSESCLSNAVAYIIEEEEGRGREVKKTYVWDRLAEAGLNGSNYKTFRRTERRSAS